MKLSSTIALLAGSLLLAASTAQAQSSFRIGPKVGYNLSSARIEFPALPDYASVTDSYRGGFEAGLVAQVGLSGHLSLQPAVLYAQKGFGFARNSYFAPNDYTYNEDYTLRFNYLTVPVNAVFSQRANGQGVQVFAGPYVGFLLGGNYKSTIRGGVGGALPGGRAQSGDVVASDTYGTDLTNGDYSSRGFDVGLQGGLGYGFDGGFQLQLSYSQGLRDLGAEYGPGNRNRETPPTYSNHAFQLSLAYLFGSN